MRWLQRLSALGRPAGPKVFCIGFNKTGTTSLHRFFQDAGWPSRHDTVWPLQSGDPGGRRRLASARCFSDGERADVRRLRGWFPDALFVLNDRDERAWLRSRVKHVLRHGEVTLAEALARPGFGAMALDFYADPRLALGAWVADRRLYHRQVRALLAGDPRFLELRVTEDPDWARTLAAFLASHGLAPRAGATGREPRANVRPDEAVPREALARYEALIDTALAAAPGG